MLIIDAMMLTRRCYAKMDFLKNSRDEPTGLEFGVLRTIQSLLKHYPGQRVVMCYESPDGSSWRKSQCPEYKASRSQSRPDASFFTRLKTLRQFMGCFYWSADAYNWEADDVMYVLSKTSTGPHFVYSNDDDLLQCVDDERNVIVVKSFQSKLFEWNEAKVREKYGVAPSRLATLRAFLGDGSDELQGCGRVDKRYLASLVEWAAVSELDAATMLDEILGATDWTDKERTTIGKYIDSGTWTKNFSLMQLRDVNTDVIVVKPKADDDFVVECLKRWEIRTLNLCEPYRDQLAKGLETDEF